MIMKRYLPPKDFKYVFQPRELLFIRLMVSFVTLSKQADGHLLFLLTF